MAEKMRMPSSGGGLVRYFDDYKSRLEFNHYWVVVMIVAVIIIELMLHLRVFG